MASLRISGFLGQTKCRGPHCVLLASVVEDVNDLGETGTVENADGVFTDSVDVSDEAVHRERENFVL